MPSSNSSCTELSPGGALLSRSMIGTLERISRDVWGYHYRIPERMYWFAGLAALLGFALLPVERGSLSIGLFVGVLALQGIVRWQLARRRCRLCLVVPLFQEGGGSEGRSSEAQTLIVDHLRRHLHRNLREMVQPVPVVITSADDGFAAKLQKRLRALFVLHGRIASRPDGSWSVYPRVLEPATKSVTHWDPFTRDRTPSNPHFGPLVTSLPPTVGVRDQEFPLDFCRDLEALINGMAGVAAEALGYHDEAERLLDMALARAGSSSNHQIDSLRFAHAMSISSQNRLDDAIDSLRGRLRHPDPSPHLLRGLAYLLGRRAWDDGPTAETDHAEAADVLRLALKDETDPQRDMTAYNLCNQIPRDTPEHHALVDQLLAPKSSYKRLWYVKQLEAIRLWIRVEAARKAEDRDGVRRNGKDAARWYGRTLRARPRLQFIGTLLRPPFVVFKTFERSPILYANTKDAHAAADHGWRARYFEWRFQRIRARHLRLGDKHLRNSAWSRAYAHFDWASIVGRHDEIEHRAQAFAACCCWKARRTKDGLAKWEKAATHHPDCLLGRALMVRQLEGLGLDTSVPGDEPTEIDDTVAYITEKFPGWTWHTDGLFISPEELARLERQANQSSG